MKILTSKDDDFIYSKLMDLLQQIKLVQGGTALASTLRRHNKIKSYLVEKQVVRLEHIESTYFKEDGSLNEDYIYSLQNKQHIVY